MKRLYIFLILAIIFTLTVIAFYRPTPGRAEISAHCTKTWRLIAVYFSDDPRSISVIRSAELWCK